MADLDTSTPSAFLPGLLGNPFAVLGTTPRTPLEALFELADTPEAAAVARTLSVPRSRLSAEASFLPGAADRADAILHALRTGQRPDPAGLPPLAACNLRAHLCAAGLATADDLRALATSMPTGADPALLDALNGDRNAAGMPPVQLNALTEVLDALTDAHAAALVTACLAVPDEAAARLAALVDGAPPGRPPTLLRRAAAAWTRRTTAELAGLESTAGAAVGAWRRVPDAGTFAAMAAALRRWAAFSRPQRLVDARAALDHPATLRALVPWRAAVRNAPEAAQLLAQLFGDELPGEGAALRDEARAAAAAKEEAALALRLDRLRDVVARLSRDVLPLRACLATRPFGPNARKEAAELWQAFDDAASASAVSEAPWAEVLKLAPLLDAPPRPGRARGVASFFAGLIARAETANRTALAEQLRILLRRHQATAAVADYERRKTERRWLPWWLAPLRSWRIARAGRRALALVDDPAQARQITAELAARRGRTRVAWVTVAAVLAVAGLGGATASLDEDYAATAPYRTLPAISLAARPAPPPPAPAPARSFAFATRPGETPPGPGIHELTRPEVRWCLANARRLRGAADAAGPADEAGLQALNADLLARCDTRIVHRLDEDAVRADVEHNRDRLRTEGAAMLDTTR